MQAGDWTKREIKEADAREKRKAGEERGDVRTQHVREAEAAAEREEERETEDFGWIAGVSLGCTVLKYAKRTLKKRTRKL
ncbi:hypothetical protein PO909_014586 [Leuciscus waleckii]